MIRQIRSKAEVQTITIKLGAPVDDEGNPVRVARTGFSKP